MTLIVQDDFSADTYHSVLNNTLTVNINPPNKYQLASANNFNKNLQSVISSSGSLIVSLLIFILLELLIK